MVSQLLSPATWLVRVAHIVTQPLSSFISTLDTLARIFVGLSFAEVVSLVNSIVVLYAVLRVLHGAYGSTLYNPACPTPGRTITVPSSWIWSLGRYLCYCVPYVIKIVQVLTYLAFYIAQFIVSLLWNEVVLFASICGIFFGKVVAPMVWGYVCWVYVACISGWTEATASTREEIGNWATVLGELFRLVFGKWDFEEEKVGAIVKVRKAKSTKVKWKGGKARKVVKVQRTRRWLQSRQEDEQHSEYEDALEFLPGSTESLAASGNFSQPAKPSIPDSQPMPDSRSNNIVRSDDTGYPTSPILGPCMVLGASLPSSTVRKSDLDPVLALTAAFAAWNLTITGEDDKNKTVKLVPTRCTGEQPKRATVGSRNSNSAALPSKSGRAYPTLYVDTSIEQSSCDQGITADATLSASTAILTPSSSVEPLFVVVGENFDEESGSESKVTVQRSPSGPEIVKKLTSGTEPRSPTPTEPEDCAYLETKAPIKPISSDLLETTASLDTPTLGNNCVISIDLAESLETSEPVEETETPSKEIAGSFIGANLDATPVELVETTPVGLEYSYGGNPDEFGGAFMTADFDQTASFNSLPPTEPGLPMFDTQPSPLEMLPLDGPGLPILEAAGLGAGAGLPLGFDYTTPFDSFMSGGSGLATSNWPGPGFDMDLSGAPTGSNLLGPSWVDKGKWPADDVNEVRKELEQSGAPRMGVGMGVGGSWMGADMAGAGLMGDDGVNGDYMMGGGMAGGVLGGEMIGGLAGGMPGGGWADGLSDAAAHCEPILGLNIELDTSFLNDLPLPDFTINDEELAALANAPDFEDAINALGNHRSGGAPSIQYAPNSAEFDAVLALLALDPVPPVMGPNEVQAWPIDDEIGNMPPLGPRMLAGRIAGRDRRAARARGPI